MRELPWSELDLCSVCFAVVPAALKGDHEAQHASVAHELVRAANAVDRIRRV